MFIFSYPLSELSGNTTSFHSNRVAESQF